MKFHNLISNAVQYWKQPAMCVIPLEILGDLIDAVEELNVDREELIRIITTPAHEELMFVELEEYLHKRDLWTDKNGYGG